MPEDKIMPDLSEVIPVRRRLGKLAADAGLSMTELCIRFVLSNPAVSSILTGVDNANQLRQNGKLLEKGPLPATLFQEVKAVVPRLAENIIRPFFWKKNADDVWNKA